MWRYFQLTTAVLAILLSSGCVYKRLWDTHQVLCADDNKVTFSVLMDGTKEVVFHRTSLLDKDVEWLIGKAPTSIEPIGDMVVHNWTARSENEKGADRTRVRVEMEFVKENRHHYLKRIRIPGRLSSVVSETLLEHSIRAACDIELNLWKKGVKFDLQEIQATDIPDLQTMRQVLGEPDGSSTDTRLGYRFCVEPCSSKPGLSDSAVVRMHYTASGEPETYYLKYLRYEATADLQSKEGTIRLLDL